MEKLPHTKEVGQADLSFVGMEKRKVTSSITGKSIEQVYLSYQFSKPDCKVVRFQKSAGYRNPFDHLRKCFARGKSRHEQEQLF